MQFHLKPAAAVPRLSTGRWTKQQKAATSFSSQELFCLFRHFKGTCFTESQIICGGKDIWMSCGTTSCQSRSNQFRWLRPMSSWGLSVSNDGDSITSLGQLWFDPKPTFNQNIW